MRRAVRQPFHGDHADSWVAEQFIDQSKPVVAPDDVWTTLPFYELVTHLPRIPHVEQSLPIQGGKTELAVVVYPGHQGEFIINNVYVVYSPEGWTFAHVGDETNYWPDVNPVGGWVPYVSLYHDIDVLVLKSRGVYVELADGFDPDLIIPGHVNEMAHVGDPRLSYLEAYNVLGSLGFPMIMPTWGERFSPFSGRAHAGPDRTFPGIPGRVVLNGTQSIGPIESYLWEQTGGPSMTIHNESSTLAQVSFPLWLQDPGPFELTFRLTVTDENGHSSTDSVTLNVNTQGEITM